MTRSRRILEIGAGENPTQEATETLDIRNDLDHIDHPGIDIGTDRLPFDDNSVDKIIANHVLEHIRPEDIGQVFREVNRVLRPGGEFTGVMPHAGTWLAATDFTHQGTGGTTPSMRGYFDGSLEPYWPELDWDVDAWAELTWPLWVREDWRRVSTVRSGDRSMQFVKIPGVTGTVHFVATKRE